MRAVEALARIIDPEPFGIEGQQGDWALWADRRATAKKTAEACLQALDEAVSRAKEPTITEAMIDAGLKAQADAVTTYTLPDLSKGPTERIKRLTMADILRAALRAAQ